MVGDMTMGDIAYRTIILRLKSVISDASNYAALTFSVYCWRDNLLSDTFQYCETTVASAVSLSVCVHIDTKAVVSRYVRQSTARAGIQLLTISFW